MIITLDRPSRISILAALAIAPQIASAGVIFTDNFSGSGSPDAAWQTDLANTENATVNVGGGNLNVNSSAVTGFETVRHTLQLDGTGAPSITLGSDWTIEAVITVGAATAFTTTSPGEGVGVSLDVRNSLPSTDDRAQVNVVALDFGGGLTHALRGSHRTSGSDVELISPVGAALTALNVTIRVSYDATNDSISFGADSGSGFTSLVSPVDTSAWSLTDSDPLEIQLELGMVKFNNDPATSTFSLTDGEASVDSFTIYDETLETVTIPEPSVAFLALLGAGCFLRRQR